MIISLTALVESNKDKFQGFVIVCDWDYGTGHLKLIHRDGVSHSMYPITRKNEIWYHTYDPLHKPVPKVKRLNNACHSALSHGRLGCAGNDVMNSAPMNTL